MQQKALFLDRDGVINNENEGDYIRDIASFQFLDGVKEALLIAQKHYDKMFIVTNQRGIGRGLMTELDLARIHNYMLNEFKASSIEIDRIYFSPFLESTHAYRKPNIGMALHAKDEFPNISLELSTMIGNNISDMEFGKKAGMQTVFLHTTQTPQQLPHTLIDAQFDSLYSWAQQL